MHLYLHLHLHLPLHLHQVPQYLLDQHAEARRPVRILVTQPRKVAASSLARRVCQERGWVLGGLVGYQVPSQP